LITGLAVINSADPLHTKTARIGLRPTRSLSKVANALVKATENIWGGVVDLHDVDLSTACSKHGRLRKCGALGVPWPPS
jgi:hypothetical protein